MSSPTCLYGFGSLGLCLAYRAFWVLLNASGGFGGNIGAFHDAVCAHPMRLTPCHDEGRMTVAFSQGPGDQEKEADS